MTRNKNGLRRKAARYRYAIAGSATAMAIVLYLVVRLLPATEDDLRTSVCHVEGRVQLCLVTGNDTIVLHEDSINQQGVWINRHWWWPGCNGRIMTIAQDNTLGYNGKQAADKQASGQMAALTDSIGRLLKRREKEKKETDYYLRSHNVQDEGYTRIAEYAERQTQITDSLKSVYKSLKAYNSDSKLQFVRKYMLRALWYDSKGQINKEDCKPLILSADHTDEPILIQTMSERKPWANYAVRYLPWGTSVPTTIYTVTLVPKDTIVPYHAILTKGHYIEGRHHNIPSLFAPDGSAVFTERGVFMGIVSKQEIKKWK